ncbi:MAG: nucleotide exchange factor GrpE [Candidatus Thermochlorobacter aerophilum]|jgi:molecular chaperone GrpE (heat shock protein)|uniref:Nucleotide exchange factor GrpE n=1 Tax=Candidatus Thermochlorobacter aerophilus TaxID=1868324 RepID=A0A395M0W3_9BACT|nr:MAG: nucleotide exchange factor GrpE [Candidatus Thermochlorobacter aerophilum]
MRIYLGLLLALLLLGTSTIWTQTQPQTVCFYIKRQNLLNPEDGLTLFILNTRQRSPELQLRYQPKTKFIYLGSTKPIAGAFPTASEIVQAFEERLLPFFTEFDKRKLSTPAQYKDLFETLLSGTHILKQVNLSAFGIPDRTLVFDADAAELNPAPLKDANSAEAMALYNFVAGEWQERSTLLDYKDRLLKSQDVLNLIRRSTLESLFATTSAAPQASLSSEELLQIQKAEERATWAFLLSFLSLIVVIYLAIISASNLRKKREQLSKLDAKVKHLESKLNKPFYQEVLQQADSSSTNFNPKTIETLLLRLVALEKKLGVERATPAFQSEMARRAQALISSYQQRWSQTAPIPQADLVQKLLFLLDEFLTELALLDVELPLKTFIQKSLIPHIDKIDALFQAEPDAPLNTPDSIQEYLRALMNIFGVQEIEIKQKQSLFDHEKHEKAGAILKTNYEPGTVLKVIRRGLLYNGSIRKAQVVKAE